MAEEDIALYNPYNYEVDDLICIIGLGDIDPTSDDIQQATDDLIRIYDEKQKYHLATFIERVQERLLSVWQQDDVDSDSDTSDGRQKAAQMSAMSAEVEASNAQIESFRSWCG